MQLQTVDSSMLHAVGYDEDSQMLEVVFNSGKVYQYFDVPKEVFEQLMASDSKGSYMRSFVIDCYEYSEFKRRGRSR